MKTKFKKFFTAAAIAIGLGVGIAPTAKADVVVDTDTLREGQTMTYTVHFYAGQYVSYGVMADDDCFDVDLVIEFPNGQRAWDTLDDARPVVSFTAPVTGDYRIRVVMVDTYHGIPSIYQLIRL